MNSSNLLIFGKILLKKKTITKKTGLRLANQDSQYEDIITKLPRKFNLSFRDSNLVFFLSE